MIFFFVGCDSIKFLEGGGGIWWKVALLLPPPPLSPPFPLGRSYNRGVCARGRHDEGGCNRRFIRSRERGRQKLKLRRDFFIPPEENKAHLCLICCRCKLLFSSSSGGKTRWVGIDGSGGFIGGKGEKKVLHISFSSLAGVQKGKIPLTPFPPPPFPPGCWKRKGKTNIPTPPPRLHIPRKFNTARVFYFVTKTVIFLGDWTVFFFALAFSFSFVFFLFSFWHLVHHSLSQLKVGGSGTPKTFDPVEKFFSPFFLFSFRGKSW